MQKHTFYRLINILILPIAAFLGIQVVMSLLVALSNPPLLLMAFIIACVPIYAFTANYFYNKGIKKGEKCRPSLKDWIKVNAIVSIIFAVFMTLACMVMIVVLNDPRLISQISDQLSENAPPGVSQAEFLKMLKMYCYIFLPFSILLLVHIIITFRLLGRYKHVFNLSDDPQ